MRDPFDEDYLGHRDRHMGLERTIDNIHKDMMTIVSQLKDKDHDLEYKVDSVSRKAQEDRVSNKKKVEQMEAVIGSLIERIELLETKVRSSTVGSELKQQVANFSLDPKYELVKDTKQEIVWDEAVSSSEKMIATMRKWDEVDQEFKQEVLGEFKPRIKDFDECENQDDIINWLSNTSDMIPDDYRLFTSRMMSITNAYFTHRQSHFEPPYEPNELAITVRCDENDLKIFQMIEQRKSLYVTKDCKVLVTSCEKHELSGLQRVRVRYVNRARPVEDDTLPFEAITEVELIVSIKGKSKLKLPNNFTGRYDRPVDFIR